MKYNIRNTEKIAQVLGEPAIMRILSALQDHFNNESFEVSGSLLICGGVYFHILRKYRDTYYLAFLKFIDV